MIFVLHLSIPVGINPMETNEAWGSARDACWSRATRHRARCWWGRRRVWVEGTGGACWSWRGFFQLLLNRYGGPDRYRWAGMRGWGEKKLRFWQKHSPNCNFLILHSPSILSTSKNMWRVSPTWGVRRVWFMWENARAVHTCSKDMWYLKKC
jgi:hypothetical protein